MARRYSSVQLASALLMIFTLFPCTSASYMSWFGMRGVQVRSKIALEGGLLSNGTLQDGQCLNCDLIAYPKGLYYTIDLTKSLDMSVQRADQILVYEEENTDPKAPNYVNGAMFHNDYQWYTFGGQSRQVLTYGMNSVNQGNLFPNNPSQTSGINEGVVPYNHGNAISPGVSENITAGAYASSPDPGQQIGWYFGGMALGDHSGLRYPQRDDSIVASTSFYKIDMSDSDHASFVALRWPEDQAAHAEGGLVWLPFGKAGVLVAFGGVITPPDLFPDVPKALPNNNTFMTDLAIYDIDGDKWYSQSTLESSPKPPQMAKFCTTVVPTKDGYSQEVFVYGGYDGTGTSSSPEYDDVWVLSVPAFQWTLVKEAEKDSTHGRSGNLCFAPNPTTIITVGGSLWNAGSLRSDTLIDVLNLNSLEWGSNYSASSDASFTAPPMIVDQLKWPSPDGPGEVTVSNLDVSVLNDLFNTPYPTQIKPNYPYATPPPDDGGKVDHHPKKWKKPVIASLCSVIPVLIIATLFFCCVNRYRKNKQGDERTQRSRRNVFSWLGKPAHDPEPEKSNTSENTAVESNPDYFNQSGYKTAKEVVYEAPSNVTSPGWSQYRHGSPGLTGVTATSPHERHEIMDQPQRESMSIRNHPYYPRSISGNHIRSVRGESLSQPSELVSSPRTTTLQTSPSELPHDKSNVNLPQAPSDMKLDQHEHGETFASTGMAAIPRKPVGERRVSSPEPSPVSPRPGHQRNQSSISSDMPILPSPEPKEDWRQSRQIEALPDVPTSAHRQATQEGSGRFSAHLETFDEATGRQ